MMQPTDNTNQFYDQNGQNFFDQTAKLDMSAIYERFLPWLPDHGTILDGGCGSGRDTKFFLSCGYNVIAIDASATMVKLASEYTSHPVIQMTFQQLNFDKTFDGIWTCASLLHVPVNELNDVISRFTGALKPNGVWYLSFKQGEGERIQADGRLFLDMTLGNLLNYINQFPALKVIDQWENEDSRPNRIETWANMIIRKF